MKSYGKILYFAITLALLSIAIMAGLNSAITFEAYGEVNIQETIDNAAEGELKTITLTQDVIIEEVFVQERKVITLDLNGFSLNGNIKNCGTLTITDNEELPGKVAGTINNCEGGTVNINGGAITTLVVMKGSTYTHTLGSIEVIEYYENYTGTIAPEQKVRCGAEAEGDYVFLNGYILRKTLGTVRYDSLPGGVIDNLTPNTYYLDLPDAINKNATDVTMLADYLSFIFIMKNNVSIDIDMNGKTINNLAIDSDTASASVSNGRIVGGLEVGRGTANITNVNTSVLNYGTVNISGDESQINLIKNYKGKVNLDGGTVEQINNKETDFQYVNEEAILNVNGGTITTLNNYAGGTVNVNGGTINTLVVMKGSTYTHTLGSIGVVEYYENYTGTIAQEQQVRCSAEAEEDYVFLNGYVLRKDSGTVRYDSLNMSGVIDNLTPNTYYLDLPDAINKNATDVTMLANYESTLSIGKNISINMNEKTINSVVIDSDTASVSIGNGIIAGGLEVGRGTANITNVNTSVRNCGTVSISGDESQISLINNYKGTVNVQGGTVEQINNKETDPQYVNDEAILNVNGGTITTLNNYAGGTVNLMGGVIGSFIHKAGGNADITGDTVVIELLETENNLTWTGIKLEQNLKNATVESGVLINDKYLPKSEESKIYSSLNTALCMSMDENNNLIKYYENEELAFTESTRVRLLVDFSNNRTLNDGETMYIDLNGKTFGGRLENMYMTLLVIDDTAGGGTLASLTTTGKGTGNVTTKKSELEIRAGNITELTINGHSLTNVKGGMIETVYVYSSFNVEVNFNGGRVQNFVLRSKNVNFSVDSQCTIDLIEFAYNYENVEISDDQMVKATEYGNPKDQYRIIGKRIVEINQDKSYRFADLPYYVYKVYNVGMENETWEKMPGIGFTVKHSSNVQIQKFILIGDTIESMDINVPEGKDITIDLSGFSLTIPTDKKFMNQGTVTIIDDSTEKKGTLSGLTMGGTGKLNVNSGTVTSLKMPNGTTNVNGGTVITIESTGNASTIVNLNSGKIENLYNDKIGRVTVSGGEVALLRNKLIGKVTITAGRVIELMNGNNKNVDGNYSLGEVNVQGGTVEKITNKGLVSVEQDGTVDMLVMENEIAKYNLTDNGNIGVIEFYENYTGTIAQEQQVRCGAEAEGDYVFLNGYILRKTLGTVRYDSLPGGVIDNLTPNTYYLDLSDALNKNATDVTMLANYESTLSIGKNISINMNEKTINSVVIDSDTASVSISNGIIAGGLEVGIGTANITNVNASVENYGTVSISGDGSQISLISNYKGMVNVQGGTVEQINNKETDPQYVNEEAILNVNGGTITTLNNYAGGTANANGGTVTTLNNYASGMVNAIGGTVTTLNNNAGGTVKANGGTINTLVVMKGSTYTHTLGSIGVVEYYENYTGTIAQEQKVRCGAEAEGDYVFLNGYVLRKDSGTVRYDSLNMSGVKDNRTPNTYYLDLPDAINKNAIDVTMLANYESTLSIGKNISINMNGKTLRSVEVKVEASFRGGTITRIDIVDGGPINLTDISSATIINYVGVNISGDESQINLIKNYKGKVNLDGGTVEQINNKETDPKYVNDEAIINVNGGTITTLNNYAGGMVNANGGTITTLNNYAGGTVKANGGTVTTLNNYASGTVNAIGGTVTTLNNNASGMLKANGGTINTLVVMKGSTYTHTLGSIGVVEYYENYTGNIVQDQQVRCGSEAEEDYVFLNGYVLRKDSDTVRYDSLSMSGVKDSLVEDTYYLDLEDALNKNATDVTMLANYESTLSIGKNISINMNEKLIRSVDVQAEVSFKGGTITEIIVVEGGTIDLTEIALSTIINYGGTVNIIGDENVVNLIRNYKGTININGGSIAEIKNKEENSDFGETAEAIVYVNGGTITTFGNKIGGTAEVIDGTIVTLNNNAGGTANVRGGIVTEANNNGTVTVSSASTVTTVNNNAGGTANVNGGTVITLNNRSESTANVNGGTVTTLNNRGESMVNVSGGEVQTLNNRGESTVNVSDGMIIILNNRSESTANVSGGTVTEANNNGILTVSATSTLSLLNIIESGVRNSNGTASVSGGIVNTLNNGQGGTASVNGGTVAEANNNGTIAVYETSTVTTLNNEQGGTASVSGGEVQTLNNRGESTVNLSGGTMANLNNYDEGTVTISDGIITEANNEGKIIISDNGMVTTLNNYTSAEAIINGGTVATINNNGTVQANGGNVGLLRHKANATGLTIGELGTVEELAFEEDIIFADIKNEQMLLNIREDDTPIIINDRVLAKRTESEAYKNLPFVVEDAKTAGKYYISVEDAIEKGATDVKMLGNADSITVESGETIVIDLNGNTINTLVNKGNITVIGESGTITILYNDSFAETIINGGTVETLNNNISAETTINGGTVETLNNRGIARIIDGIIGSINNDSATVDITGGTFKTEPTEFLKGDYVAYEKGEGNFGVRHVHEFETTSYVWSENNETCTATRVCTHDATHIETEIANSTSEITQEKTCTNDELTKYTVIFENSAFTQQIKENVKTADKFGHNYGEPAYVWSENNETCTATRVCSHDTTHIETEIANSTSEITQEKTCTNDELTKYIVIFENSAFIQQIKENVKTADKFGHNYGEPIYAWSENNEICIATRVCTQDTTHIETEIANSTSEITQEKTCTNDELTKYTVIFENSAFIQQIKENVKTADKFGHNYGEPTYVWSENNETCTATRVCTHDTTHIETEIADRTSEITQEKTCTNDELTKYTVIFENSAFIQQIEENVKTADKLGHDMAIEWSKDNENHWHVCSLCGYVADEEGHIHGSAATEEMAQTCTVCGYEISPKLNHNPILIKGYEETTTAPGKKDYYHCGVCGKNYADATSTSEITTDIEKWRTIPMIIAVIDGNGGEWEKGTREGLAFKHNIELDALSSVSIDGVVIDKVNYTVEKNSVILNSSYLETLSVGEHTIATCVTNDSADAVFFIRKKNNLIFLWIAIPIIVIGLGVAIFFIIKNKIR